MMVARFYGPLLRTPLILYPSISLSIGILTGILYQWTLGIALASMLSLIISVMFYFFPILFCRKDCQMIETTLPATVGERLTFYTVCCLVVNPLLSYGPYYLGKCAVGFFIQDNEFATLVAELTSMVGPGMWVLSTFQSLVPLTTCMMVALTFTRNRIGMSVVWTIVSVVLLGVASAVAGIILALHGVFDGFVNMSENTTPEDVKAMAVGFVQPLLWIVGVFGMVYTAFMVWLTGLRMKKMQL